MGWHAEIWQTGLTQAAAQLPGMLALASVGAVAALGARRLPVRHRALVDRFLLLLAVGLGAWLVASRAAVFDDAFISFRYARNLVEGHGLVFNVGERVEGYTNVLWTLLIAALMWLTSIDAPELSLLLGVGVWCGNLWVVLRLSRALCRGLEGWAPPIAVLLVSVQSTFASFGTSGLETGLGALLVNLGALSLMHAEHPTQLARAGLWLIAATFTRPDHALFYVVGSAVVLWGFGPAVLRARGGGPAAVWSALVPLLSWAAPALLYGLYLVWRLSYYGDVLPNTYYAKLGGSSNLPQGLVYAHSFYLGSHMWLPALLFVAALWRPADDIAIARFRLFALGSVLLYNAYVLRVGGDFMFGRFYVCLIPLLLLGAERFLRELLSKGTRRATLMAALCGALLGASAGGLDMIEPRALRWHLADESSVYPVTGLGPVEIDHSNFRIGRKLARLHAAGLEPLVATSGVGMLGYNSRLPLLDRVGLVDRVVARQQVAKRGRPGHEKWAPDWYIERRNPHFIRGGDHIPRRYDPITRIDFGPGTGNRRWRIYHYDRALMDAVARALPETRFTDFPAYLDDYLSRAEVRPRHELERDGVFFRRYYLDHNDDAARRARLDAALSAAPAP